LGVPIRVSTLAESRLEQAEYSRGSDHALYQGDCLELLPALGEASFDLVFADPPYFLSNGGFTCQSGRRAPVEKGAWDQSRGREEDHQFAVRWLSACQRVLKPSGSIWVSGTQHVIFSVGFAMQQLGFKILNTVTWYKPNASPNLSCRYFTHSTELLIWAAPQSAGKLRHQFNYQAMKAENGGKQMRDVWNLPRAGEEELAADGRGRLWSQLTPRRDEKEWGRHPTQKPLRLLQRVIASGLDDDSWGSTSIRSIWISVSAACGPRHSFRSPAGAGRKPRDRAQIGIASQPEPEGKNHLSLDATLRSAF
jgi:site-specific DNA-methyltransferase (adenine-specific)